METQKKNVPSAKIVTFVSLGCLAVICGLFFAGLVKVPDISFVGIIDEINLQIDNMQGLDGFAALCTAILEATWPIVALLFAVVIGLKLLLCWIPVARVKKIGWSVASIRLGKKLRAAAVWALTYMVFCFTVFGKNAEFTVWGITALVVIAAFILGRVFLDHFGKKDKIFHMAFSLSSTAVICVFSLVLFIYLLSYNFMGVSLWGRVFVCFEELLEGNAFALNFMYIISFVLLFIAINLARNAIKKQITMDKSGVRKSMISLLVWVVVAAILDFFACRLQTGGLSFGDWMDLPTTKFIFTAVILGAVGVVLVIVAKFVGNIGKEKALDENAENVGEVSENTKTDEALETAGAVETVEEVDEVDDADEMDDAE